MSRRLNSQKAIPRVVLPRRPEKKNGKRTSRLSFCHGAQINEL
jgi:hypothetical protein